MSDYTSVGVTECSAADKDRILGQKAREVHYAVLIIRQLSDNVGLRILHVTSCCTTLIVGYID